MNIININQKKSTNIHTYDDVLCVIGSSITGASARDTLWSLINLPLMFAAVALVMVTFIAIYNRIASKIDLIKAIYMSSLFSAQHYLL